MEDEKKPTPKKKDTIEKEVFSFDENDPMAGVIDEGSHGLIVGRELVVKEKHNGEVVLEEVSKANGLDFDVEDTTLSTEKVAVTNSETGLALTCFGRN